MEVHADLLLIDERIGRKEAKERHLVVTGTLAVLLRAARAGRLDFPETLTRLQHFGFRVSPVLAASLLADHAQENTKR